MKISKLAQIVKKKACCAVVHTPDGLYLGPGTSLYKAEELPDMSGEAQVGAVLDIAPGKMGKIALHEYHCAGTGDITGFDLSDGKTRNEVDAERMKIAAVLDGYSYAAFRCSDDELVFFDEELLKPLEDKLKDKDTEMYINYAVRADADGKRYIVVKDGLSVIGAILPVSILSNEYLGDLQDFLLACIDQFQRDKERADKCAAKKAAQMQQEAFGGPDDGE